MKQKPLAAQSAIAGAPALLIVRTKDGERTFLVNKPSPKDLILMQKWLLAQPVPGATQGLCDTDLDGLSPERQVLLMREFARSKAGKRSPTEAEAVELLYSPAGVTMQVWLAARRNHPGLTREEVAALITEENCEQVALDLDEATGAEGKPEDPKAPAGPTSSSATPSATSPSPSSSAPSSPAKDGPPTT